MLRKICERAAEKQTVCFLRWPTLRDWAPALWAYFELGDQRCGAALLDNERVQGAPSLGLGLSWHADRKYCGKRIGDLGQTRYRRQTRCRKIQRHLSVESFDLYARMEKNGGSYWSLGG